MSAVTALLLLLLVLAPLPQPPHGPMSLGSSGKPISYAVLGDSTAAGVGAPYADGIAVQTARHLSGTHRVTLHNFGVSGARMHDVARDQLRQARPVAPDVVLLSAGANDVTHLTPIPSMRTDLRDIVTGLRAANPAVRIVITGAPDMGSPPRIPWVLRWAASLRTQAVNRMFTTEAQALNLLFAPIAARTGPLFRENRTLFHPDQFHPNARGYATWVEVLNEVLAMAVAER